MKNKILFFTILAISFIGPYFVIQNLQKPKNLKVYFLDVGQGDAVFIKTPAGNTMLIDSGIDNSALSVLSKKYIFRKKHIDIMLATHPDADHVGGFNSILRVFSTKVFIENGFNKDNQLMKQIDDLLFEHKIQTTTVKEGSIVDLGSGVVFKIFAPNDSELSKESNNSSIVGQIIYGDTKFLLTGDATISNEIRLINEYKSSLESDVLKLGHHGSRTSSTVEFLETVKPKISVVSAGRNNRYGHPHPEVLARLKNLKIPYLSTINEGTICLQSNGQFVTKCR